MSNKQVECDNHGIRIQAFVCQHLNMKDKVGFNEPYDQQPGDEPEDDYQAWCDECEKRRIKGDDWEEFAQVKVVCDECFFEMKKINKS